MNENKKTSDSINVFNKILADELHEIYINDQKYRLESRDYEKKYGRNDKVIDSINICRREQDSINLKRVTEIIDTYGWLGPKVVGEEGNLTIFLVLQHSNQKTQEKYLPIMREAANKGNARKSNLALLEDRVALGQGKKQIYGSQVAYDTLRKVYYLRPLENPDEVDIRRKAVGLQPLSEYLKKWNIEWNVEMYKKKLSNE